jgi:tetratricopeptide (TPR) repeat protein
MESALRAFCFAATLALVTPMEGSAQGSRRPGDTSAGDTVRPPRQDAARLAHADTSRITKSDSSRSAAPQRARAVRPDSASGARPDSASAVGADSPSTARPDSAEAALAGAPARVATLLREGDEATARLEPAAALQAYQAAVTADPSNYEALWKTGRTLIDLGELETKGNSQKDKYNKALKYAERAVKVNTAGADGHFVRAYALGRVALFEGGKTKIRLSRQVKAEAQRAIDLNPLHDGAYHVLGAWNYDLADLNFVERAIANTLLGGVPEDASFENAAHYYQLAIQANPSNINHHLEYARTLIKLGRKDEARVELERVLSLSATDLDDAAHKAEAHNLLERIG